MRHLIRATLASFVLGFVALGAQAQPGGAAADLLVAGDSAWGSAGARTLDDSAWGKAGVQALGDSAWGKAGAQAPGDSAWGSAGVHVLADSAWGRTAGRQP
ncbi:hypothetical protein [Streptomyces cyaneofuscatus]|uniref:hypothetical protein n=1 Tax=Streptomyces cyaneofuscatus TaxID=66883 RepID=UPI0036B2A616